MNYLATFVRNARKVLNGLVVDLVAAITVAALPALALAVVVLGARVLRRDANAGSDLAFVVMPEAFLLLLLPLFWAVFVRPAQVQGQGQISSDRADSLPGVAEVLEADVIVKPAAVVVLDAGGKPLGVVHAEHCIDRYKLT
jgi:hypothetical protein